MRNHTLPSRPTAPTAEQRPVRSRPSQSKLAAAAVALIGRVTPRSSQGKPALEVRGSERSFPVCAGDPLPALEHQRPPVSRSDPSRPPYARLSAPEGSPHVRRLRRWLLLGILGNLTVASASHLVQAAPLTGSCVLSAERATASAHSENIAARVVAGTREHPLAGRDPPQPSHAWWPSACSVFALSAVLRTFGVQTGPGLVLDEELVQKALPPTSGLISLEGAATLVPHFYGKFASTLCSTPPLVIHRKGEVVL